jgi:translocation and assembly module TamB
VLELDVSARDLVLSGRAFGTGALRVTGGDAPLMIALTLPSAGELTAAPGAAARPGATSALGSGSLQLRTPFPLASLLRGWPSRDALARTPFEVTGELRGMSLAALSRWAQSTTIAGGTAALRVSASGTALAPAGALNLQVEGVTGPGFPPTDARLDAAFGAHDTRVAVRVLRGGRELASASGILGLAARRLHDLRAVAAAPLDLRAAVGPLRLSRADIPGDPGEETTAETLSMTVRAALSLAGSLADPHATATVDLANARYGQKPIGEARLLLSYATGRAQADVRIHATTNGQLRLTGWSALDLGYPWRARGIDVGAASLAAKLDAQRFDLTMLSGISPQVRGVGGELSGTCTVGGTVRTPLVRGQVEWVKGALTLTGFGSYSNIHLKAHGDPSAVWLDELSLASGEGSGRLAASAVKNGAGDYDLKSNLSLRRFPVYAQGQALAVVAADGSIDGQFVSHGAGNGTATTTPNTLNASVRLSEAHVELTDAKRKDLQPLERPADVVFVNDGRPLDHREVPERPRSPTKNSLGPTPSPLGVHLEIAAPRNLWVRGKDASLELGLAPGFHAELGVPAARIYGQVVVRRGRIDVLGRRFDLQAGSLVQFTGRPDTPRVDVSAKHINETENITVMLKAKGTLDKMVISVSCPDRPDLTEGQLYALIVTGKLQLGGNTAGSTSPSDEAASLVGGIVAARLQETLAKRLPLDVLTLQAGEGLTGSRLEAGTYLTRKLYAGYVGRVGANPALLQNRNAVHVEYQLGRRWSFDGEYGDVGTGTADIVWTKDY